MERFRVRLVRDRKLLAGLLLVPLAGLFVGSTGVPWLGLFAPSHVVEASATMVDPPAPPPIDGKRAYGYLKQICEIGPRTAGSAANARQRELVKVHFKKMGAEIHEQPFQINHPQTGQPLNLCNLIGSWHPERIDRVLLAAHYDTRPHADEEVNPARRAMPFVGANDGASGVALLMEIAHHLDKLDTQWGVDLVLLDGEELVFGNRPKVGDYFLGSIEFARIYSDQVAGKRTQKRYAAGILFDMVGGKNLQLPQDPYSVEHAPRLVSEVWSVAKSLEAKSFQKRMGREVTDDHIALNEAGIPTIDLIDFDYRFWHTIDDVPENCSAESLEQVGRVVTGWLAVPRVRARPRARR